MIKWIGNKVTCFNESVGHYSENDGGLLVDVKPGTGSHLLRDTNIVALM